MFRAFNYIPYRKMRVVFLLVGFAAIAAGEFERVRLFANIYLLTVMKNVLLHQVLLVVRINILSDIKK